MIFHPTSAAPNSHSQGLRPTVFWRIVDDIPLGLKWLLFTLSFLVPLILWWVLSGTGAVDPTFLPSPVKVVGAFGTLWQKGYLLKDTIASCFRVGCGFLLAAILSVPIGIGMGTFPSIRALLEPIIGFIRYMPAPAFIPLLIIYLGIKEPPKIALIFIGTIFFNILMIMDAVKFVPKELIETTYTLGGKQSQVLLRVITPFVVPKIIDAFRVNMAASWNLVVIAELVAANEGLGKRVELAQRFFQTDEIFALLLILGLIGFCLDLFFRWLLNISCQWSVE
jgi:NitT/TauT family transport system permease protein